MNKIMQFCRLNSVSLRYVLDIVEKMSKYYDGDIDKILEKLKDEIQSKRNSKQSIVSC